MTSRPNPFVATELPNEPEVVDIPDEIMGERIVEYGPSSPEHLGLKETAGTTDSWPRVKIQDHRSITICGLHGGAGASTVATLFGDTALDAGQGFPIAAGWVRPLPTLKVIAVARTHHTGLAAADEFTQQWATGQLHESELLGLILIDDGPALITSQKKLVKRLLKKVPLGGHIPWQDEWRHDFPDTKRLPLRIKRMMHAFNKLAQNGDSK